MSSTNRPPSEEGELPPDSPPAEPSPPEDPTTTSSDLTSPPLEPQPHPPLPTIQSLSQTLSLPRPAQPPTPQPVHHLPQQAQHIYANTHVSHNATAFRLNSKTLDGPLERSSTSAHHRSLSAAITTACLFIIEPQTLESELKLMSRTWALPRETVQTSFEYICRACQTPYWRLEEREYTSAGTRLTTLVVPVQMQCCSSVQCWGCSLGALVFDGRCGACRRVWAAEVLPLGSSERERQGGGIARREAGLVLESGFVDLWLGYLSSVRRYVAVVNKAIRKEGGHVADGVVGFVRRLRGFLWAMVGSLKRLDNVLRAREVLGESGFWNAVDVVYGLCARLGLVKRFMVYDEQAVAEVWLGVWEQHSEALWDGPMTILRGSTGRNEELLNGCVGRALKGDVRLTGKQLELREGYDAEMATLYGQLWQHETQGLPGMINMDMRPSQIALKMLEVFPWCMETVRPATETEVPDIDELVVLADRLTMWLVEAAVSMLYEGKKPFTDEFERMEPGYKQSQ
ncbi:hypothetical protein BT63DRAFT_461494 [Microthyrium microscopicum]|uniref:Uncharacterized protein n=1 Tax=Microthyrium microscopicum TaxID=703497 RepID=A0A6A6TTJ8_9PEZI|nr:hypothetical protein BT63DRAFT_461494 [Microthyrium microscopicum]